MTPQPQHELRVSERPIRSDYARERAYARRRMTTLAVLALIICGVCYAIWGRGPSEPAEIPTIKAEGPYKQKPADPGGIEIPHQDVRVYDALESKNAPPTAVEHLLPPPEIPQETTHAASPPSPIISTVAPTTAKQSSTPPPTPPNDTIFSEQPTVRAIPTTVTALPAVVPMASIPASPPPSDQDKPSEPTNTAPQSIEQVIEHTKAAPSALAAKTYPSGSAAVQLASSPDESKAQAMMKELEVKYEAQLGATTLHLVRADLGNKGIYYRIQSQSLSEEAANQICSSLKQFNAGCILVRK